MDLSVSQSHTPTDISKNTVSSALSLLVKDGEMSPDGPDSSGQLVPPPTPDKRTPRARPAPAAQSKEEAEAAPAEWTMLEEAAAEWAVEEEEEQEEGVAEGEEEELEGEVETLEGEVEGLEGDEEELKGEEAPQSVQAWSCGVVPWRSTFQLQPPDENNNKRTCRCAKILSRLAALEGEVAMAKKAAAEAMAAAMACRAGAASAAVASVATVVEDSPAESGGQHHTPGRKSLQTTPKSAQKGEHLRKLPKKGTLYGRWCVCLFVCFDGVGLDLGQLPDYGQSGFHIPARQWVIWGSPHSIFPPVGQLPDYGQSGFGSVPFGSIPYSRQLSIIWKRLDLGQLPDYGQFGVGSVSFGSIPYSHLLVYKVHDLDDYMIRFFCLFFVPSHCRTGHRRLQDI